MYDFLFSVGKIIFKPITYQEIWAAAKWTRLPPQINNIARERTSPFPYIHLRLMTRSEKKSDHLNPSHT